jgi:hypothetical protein
MIAITLVVLGAVVPAGYWPEAKSDELLAKTQTIRLSPDLSSLDENERAALKDLLEAGALMQKVYEESRHHQALSAHKELLRVHETTGRTKRTANLLTLYRLNHGPIASTLDNKREAFLPVAPQVPGRNVYPIDVTREELDAFLAAIRPCATTSLPSARSCAGRRRRIWRATATLSPLTRHCACCIRR